MNELTTLTDQKVKISKKPYGWHDMAIWCMTAMLFKRGKIEGKQDTNILEDAEFLEALMNNRHRSEERRVGKECRARGLQKQYKRETDEAEGTLRKNKTSEV